MYTSNPFADDPTALREDMPLRGYQRSRAEVAAARRMETATKSIPPVDQAALAADDDFPSEASMPAVARAAAPSESMFVFVAAVPAEETFVSESSPVSSVPVAAVAGTAIQAAPIPAAPAVPTPHVTPRVDPVAPIRVTTPKATISARGLRTQHSTMGPWTLGAIGLVAVAIAGLVWPITLREAPAAARESVRPVQALAPSTPPGPDSSSTVTAPTAVAPPVSAPAPLADARSDVRTGGKTAGTPPPAEQLVTRDVPPARASSARETPVATESEGRLRVTSTPPGARVSVNGIGWGQTPLTIGHLPLGTKSVRVTTEGFASQERTVNLRAGEASASLHVTLTRSR